MDRVWRLIFVAPLLAACVGAGHAAGITNVPLRHTSVEAAYAAVKDTPGLESVTVHLKDYSISFSGTEEAVGEAKSRLAQVDVPARPISLQVSFIRYERDARGKTTERTVLSPLLMTLDHIPVTLEPSPASGVPVSRFSLTPVLHRDGTVTVYADVRQTNEKGHGQPALLAERRVRPDAPARLLGLTSSEDKLLRHAVEAGEVVMQRGPYVATYMDITVRRVAADGAK